MFQMFHYLKEFCILNCKKYWNIWNFYTLYKHAQLFIIFIIKIHNQIEHNRTQAYKQQNTLLMCFWTTNRHNENQFSEDLLLCPVSAPAAVHNTYTGVEGPRRTGGGRRRTPANGRVSSWFLVLPSPTLHWIHRLYGVPHSTSGRHFVI